MLRVFVPVSYWAVRVWYVPSQTEDMESPVLSKFHARRSPPQLCTIPCVEAAESSREWTPVRKFSPTVSSQTCSNLQGERRQCRTRLGSSPPRSFAVGCQ
eukprot:3188463-Prymnesium_polylepis.1